MPDLNPEDFRARRFNTAVEPITEISIALREIVRHINRLDRSFVQVGQAGFVTRTTMPPAKESSDLVRTFDAEAVAAGEGDGDLGSDVGIVGSEIP